MSRHRAGAFSTAVVGVLALAVLSYVAAGLASLLADSPRQSEVCARSVETGFNAEGIIIRSEIALEGGQAAESRRLGAGDSMGEGFSAPASGLYFSFSDGYEHLSPADITEPDAESIAALISAAPGESAEGRLVTGKYWYFAALLPPGLSLEEGAELHADFGKGDTHCLVHAAGDGFAVLRMDTALGEHAGLRRVTAKIITESCSGLAIDPAALHSEGGENFVRVPTAGRLEKKTVNILFTAPDFLLVEALGEPDALREGDRVLIGGEQEGKIIK